MYDPNLYGIDVDRRRHEAEIRSGAYLYRLATINHCDWSDVLSGKGSLIAREKGRFNAEQQQVSYCANNILVTFAEVLFHMYNLLLKRLGEKHPTGAIYDAVEWNRCLTIFRVDAIQDLVFIDSEGAQVEFDSRIRGATVVFPEPIYKLFLELNEKARIAKKKGIVYPSARHSKDYCFALFDDETSRLQQGSFRMVPVRLRLIAESQDFSEPIKSCDPLCEKLHPTMGYYEILDEIAFDKAKTDGVLNPEALPARGLIDFVRRRYKEYPKQAAMYPMSNVAKGNVQGGSG